MRVAVTSDLHLGLTPEARLRTLAASIAAAAPRVLVVAGDVAEGPAAFLDCLRIFAEALPDCECLVLAGNHDLWAREGAGSRDLFDRLLPSLARDAGFRWLEQGPAVIGDRAVAGTIAWYDYSAADPALPLGPSYYAAHRHLVEDGRFMDPGFDDRAFAAERGEAFLASLHALEEDPAVSRVLVVTHVPVLEAQVERRPFDPEWSLRNAYFGNLTLGREVVRFRKVAAVVSGHTHVGKRVRVARAEGAALEVAVVGSDYGRPEFVTLQV